MDVFPGWENYVSRIFDNWHSLIAPDDTVVLAGDSSWGMNLNEARADLEFIDKLPGRKIILKGNHDYWWTTANKMEKFFLESGFSTLNILHNNHYKYENFGICGTRGWINDNGEAADKKVLLREAGRLEASIASAERQGLEPIVFLHYPPVFNADSNYEILAVMEKHRITRCYYGHIHGKSCSNAMIGFRNGIEYSLISSDYLQFKPEKIF
jgi:hypothetical protein